MHYHRPGVSAVLRATVRRHGKLGTLALIVLTGVLALTASAATGAPQKSKSQAAFKQQLTIYSLQMEQVAKMLSASPQGRAAAARLRVSPAGDIAGARRQLKTLSPAQVASLQYAFAKMPNWRQQPQVLKEALVRRGFSTRGTAGVDENCDPGPGTPLGITDVYIAKGVALALEILRELLPTDGVTIVAREIPTALWGAAETAALVLEGLNAVEAECNGAKLEHFTRTQLDVAVSTRASQTSLNSLTTSFSALSTLINSRLDVAVSTRASQTSLDTFHSEFTSNATVVNTKLDAITTSLTSAHQKLDTLALAVDNQGKLALRMHIEADLADPSNHPVALFELPAAQGGYLELTREIVVDTIARMQAAGQSVGPAASALAAGDAAVAAHAYKRAYSFYGNAYRAAAA